MIQHLRLWYAYPDFVTSIRTWPSELRYLGMDFTSLQTGESVMQQILYAYERHLEIALDVFGLILIAPTSLEVFFGTPREVLFASE